MRKVFIRCTVLAISNAVTIALYLWVGWWVVTISLLPAFVAAAMWANEREVR